MRLSELVWAGLVASDGFAGLRAIWSDSSAVPSRQFRGRSTAAIASPGGRWSTLDDQPGTDDRQATVEAYA